MKRTKKIKVHGVSIDVDGTDTHWTVSTSPGPELQAQGISPLRATMPKCLCDFSRLNRKLTRGGRCRRCHGLDALAVGTYMVRLLRAYPKQTVEVPVAVR